MIGQIGTYGGLTWFLHLHSVHHLNAEATVSQHLVTMLFNVGFRYADATGINKYT